MRYYAFSTYLVAIVFLFGCTRITLERVDNGEQLESPATNEEDGELKEDTYTNEESEDEVTQTNSELLIDLGGTEEFETTSENLPVSSDGSISEDTEQPGEDSDVSSDSPTLDTDSVVPFDSGDSSSELGVADSGNDIATQSCGSCIKNACGSENSICVSNPSCLQLSRCDSECGYDDQDCHTNCYNEHPEAFGLYFTVHWCKVKNCKDPCQIPSSDCDDCTATSCYSQITTCLDNNDCAQLWLCVINCKDDQKCLQDCVSMHPDGANFLQDLADCVHKHCVSKCGQ